MGKASEFISNGSSNLELNYEQSLFCLGPALDPSIKACETRKWQRAWLRARDRGGFFSGSVPPSFLASSRRSRACALPSINLKRKRNCARSKFGSSRLAQLSTGVDSDAALHMSRTKSRKFLLLTSPKCALFAFEFNAAPCNKDPRIYSVVMRLWQCWHRKKLYGLVLTLLWQFALFRVNRLQR